jgi:hypothetical protein
MNGASSWAMSRMEILKKLMQSTKSCLKSPEDTNSERIAIQRNWDPISKTNLMIHSRTDISKKMIKTSFKLKD